MRGQQTYSRHIVSRVLAILTPYSVYVLIFLPHSVNFPSRDLAHRYIVICRQLVIPLRQKGTMAVVEDFWIGAPFPGGAIPAR